MEGKVIGDGGGREVERSGEDSQVMKKVLKYNR